MSIKRWKDWAAFFRPNGIQRNSNRRNGVMILLLEYNVVRRAWGMKMLVLSILVYHLGVWRIRLLM